MAPGIRTTFSTLFVLLAAACGGEPAEPAKSPHDETLVRGRRGSAEGGTRDVAPPKAAADLPAAKLAPITSLKRTAVKETIAQGLGVFLQNVTVEDWPVMHEGKFHGFKIRTLNPDWSIDLRPGDIVTRINGVVPEHPEDADTALRSLEKAKSLKVDYERDGKAKTLELPIVD